MNPNEQEVMLLDHERRLTAVEEIARETHDLSLSMAVMAEKQDHTVEELKKANQKIDSIISKPQARWEKIVEGVILAILTGLVAYVLARLGFK